MPWTFIYLKKPILTDSDFKKVFPIGEYFFKSLSVYLSGKRTSLKQVGITRPRTVAKLSKQAKASTKAKPKAKQPKVKQGSLFSRK